MGVCGCVIPSPDCHCHFTPVSDWQYNNSTNHLVTMPKDVLDQIGKEHTEEIERLREALHHCVKALAEFEKDSNLPIEQFQYNVVFKLKGYLLGALDNAKQAIGGK